MAQLQPVRGTRDLLADDYRKFRRIGAVAYRLSSLYGFEGIETPLFESSAVFSRTLGDTSDIVTKQMYTFLDRGGDEITLRPEGTAGVARAFISEGLSQLLPLKLFYNGPMFRYERPQKGRYRQFYQFGVELLGVETPQADIEVIALGDQILRALKVDDRVQLQLNTIGDSESREAYRLALVEYLTDFRAELSPDSQMRLDKNPLRILDSKDEGDQKLIKNAPTFAKFLNGASQDFFGILCEGLSQLKISYRLDPQLVRGLDYYCHTVFEFTTTALGSQNAVLSGGRYDGLIQSMGGPRTPGVGWAAGTDRLAMLIADPVRKKNLVAIIPMGAEAERPGFLLAQALRNEGFAVDLGYSGNAAKRFKRADKLGARFALVLGSEELTRESVTVKDLAAGSQSAMPLADLRAYLRQKFSE